MSVGNRSPRTDRAATVDIFELAMLMGQDPLPRQQHCLCRMRDHHENTPSMMVYPKTNSFFCWGCKAGGDTIAYVMGCEGVGFLEALKKIEELFKLPDMFGRGTAFATKQVSDMVAEMRGKYSTPVVEDPALYASMVERKVIQEFHDLYPLAKRVGGLSFLWEVQDRTWYDIDVAVSNSATKDDLNLLMEESARSLKILEERLISMDTQEL